MKKSKELPKMERFQLYEMATCQNERFWRVLVQSLYIVRIPKVRSKDGEALTFRSVLVPPYVRKTRSLEAALPWLYLKGVSNGEMGEALKVLVGQDAQGLSASTVSRLKSEWANESQHWRETPLDEDSWGYIWADGIYSGLRSEKDKLCALVIIGVNERGQKQFLAIEDGVRESTHSWR